MNTIFREVLLKCTKANSFQKTETIQSLWSGYGSIDRYRLSGADRESIIVKHVKLPKQDKHPRGWNTDLSHRRKVRSYEIETNWYQHYAAQCDDSCKVPQCLAIERYEDEVFMVMEDLDSSGFPVRKTNVNWDEIRACLKWLANFHATFINQMPEGLWTQGTYWHLDTRPDELEVLRDKALKNAATEIDRMLQATKYYTFVHGDAKLANFCFSPDGKNVAAVDFQYVGGGCGMKDLAYFIGSCLYEDDCEQYEEQLLSFYFEYLKKALSTKQPTVNFIELESEWRQMFPVAWTDFHRFLKGWSPGHWKLNSYSEKIAKEVVEQIRTSS